MLIPTSILDDVTKNARTYLRDFPKYFQVAFDAAGRTYELGHPNIDVDSFYIATYTSSNPVEMAASAFSLDARNGLVRLASTPDANSKIMVEGYYYEWVLPADLEYYAKRAVENHVYNLQVDLENMSDILLDTIGMATLIETLWSLFSEYSRDIDVMTSESVHIPGSQRARNIQTLLDYWMNAYDKRARALNIGLDRIEVFTLSRVSRTTNRYIPIYVHKELGDYGQGSVCIDEKVGDVSKENSC